jgi:predicted metal-dependent peptidase
MQVDIETFGKQRGDIAGGLIQNLKEVNREKYDYTSFLKKFAVMGETMKINDDEFDYIFYTYGLKLYDKMPLIEPLEYKEVKRIKEFVIAIDTSGSTSGELVQKFVQKTYNILKSIESFFSKINLHIIQCDADIQDVSIIKNLEELEEYMNNLVLHGFGGTNFIPVFQYVDEIFSSSKQNEINGLIYFTDGEGVYPKQMPKFKSVFLINDSCFDKSKMPLWATPLFLDSEDLL